MISSRLAFALAAAALFLSTAQAGGVKTSPCAAEVKKYCSNFKPGDAQIGPCLQAHNKDLSPGCSEHLKGFFKLADQQRPYLACTGDVEKFCADVKPQSPLVGKCLNDNWKNLSDACRAVLPKRSPQK